MTEFVLLRDLTVVIAAALVVVTFLRPLGVPAIAGFLITGALVGPRAIGLVKNAHDVEILSEVGVVLLLFGIGLELSLDRVKRLWRAVAVAGSLQVGLTVAVGALFALGLGLPAGASIFLGMLVATSSTAIVLRGLSVRGELDAPHGRLALGILVFQDFCVLPMMLAIPALAGGSQSGADLIWSLGETLLILTAILIASRLLVPRLFEVVAKTRQRDLFVLVVVATCLGVAWAASFAGVSLALGAFLGGLVVAGTSYRHQALAEMIPMREVLTSVFFVSVGMLVDPAELVAHPGQILGLAFLLVAGKFVLVAAATSVMGFGVRVTVLVGLSLCQVGEFSFVLLRAAEGTSLVQNPLLENLEMAIILSMLVTPFILRFSPLVAAGAEKSRTLTRLLSVRSAAEASSTPEVKDPAHVIVAGLGIAGEELVQGLKKMEIPFVAIDLNPESVRVAAQAGVPAFFGDATSADVLDHLGIKRARALVLTINDVKATLRAAQVARELAPDVYIVARVPWMLDVSGLMKAGANAVVCSELTAASEVAQRVLLGLGADEGLMEEVERRIERRIAAVDDQNGSLP
jgi:CPA2 family monovalent cation:H+ antiporter-2